VATVVAFVELVACAVLSILDYAFSFFFQIVLAMNVLAGHGVDASWTSHATRHVGTSILTNINQDTAQYLKNMAKNSIQKYKKEPNRNYEN
jgi:hypothetical protein